MGYLGRWLPTLIAMVAMVAVAQQGAVAKTAREVNQIAQFASHSVVQAANGRQVTIIRA